MVTKPSDAAVFFDGFLGFFAPAGMAPATLEAVYRELARAIATPEITAAFLRDGYTASGMPPAEFVKFLRNVSERWAAVIRDTGVRLDQ
jgi:tripartite-type tricarboxylate transporter receptor subunit TctC